MKKTAVLLASLGMSVSALAATQTANHHHVAPKNLGFYADANIGYGHVHAASPTVVIPSLKVKDHSMAYTLDLGYQFSKHLSVEAGLAHFATYKATQPAQEEGEKASTAKTYIGGVTLAAKGSFNLNQDIEMFGKAGFAYLIPTIKISGLEQTHQYDNSFVPMFAAGAAYHLTPKIDLSAQVLTTLKANAAPATLAGLVGVGYHFG